MCFICSFVQSLSTARSRKSTRTCQTSLCGKGEQILAPNGEPQLVIVASGSMKVYQLSASGKEQLLRVIEPGGYEGESQLLGVPNESLFGEALEKRKFAY